MNKQNRRPITDAHLDLAAELITTAVESPYVSDFASVEQYEWGWRNRPRDVEDDGPFEGTRQGITEMHALPEARQTWASVTLIERDWDPSATHKRVITLYPIDLARVLANAYSGELTADQAELAPIHFVDYIKAYHNPKDPELDFDAIDAMNVLQIAWFGKVVYG